MTKRNDPRRLAEERLRRRRSRFNTRIPGPNDNEMRDQLILSVCNALANNLVGAWALRKLTSYIGYEMTYWTAVKSVSLLRTLLVGLGLVGVKKK